MPYTIPIKVDTNYNEKIQRYVHYGHLPEPGPLTPLQYGWHETPSCYGYGPTIRDHFLLHFILRGKGKVVVYNHQYSVGEGHCFAIFPHQITYYEADSEDPWIYYWLGFEGEWAAEMMTAAGFSDESIALRISNAEAVFSMLRDLGGQMNEPDFFLLLTAQLHTLFYHLRRRGDPVVPIPYQEAADPMQNEYVRILLSIIHTSYSERINVQQLANRLGLNRCYMSDLFHRHTGQSIKGYLHEYRLQRAQVHLQDPRISVKSAALECGFQDPLYFSRAFRERFGLSPQQYRASEEANKPR